MTTQRIDFAGYSDCLEIFNKSTRLILGPHCGGRVLSYRHNGREALFLDPAHDGWTWTPGDEEPIDPSGGRADFGPERKVPSHESLWLGQWEVEGRSPTSAELISNTCSSSGIAMRRLFELDPNGSHVCFSQTLRNVSNESKRLCHWGRTFGAGGGICVIPLTGDHNYDFIRFDPEGVVRNPDDPNIRVREGFVEVLGPPQSAKLGFDTKTVWFAYAEPNDLLFVKRYPVDIRGEYGDVENMTISLYYPDHRLCELEPIGPMQTLKPGQETTFSEDWWLLDFPFPNDDHKLNLQTLEALVAEKTK
ncbi:MAG: hypothetical protein ACOCVL_01600 [Candidatus Sumerlaeota bacterium]